MHLCCVRELCLPLFLFFPPFSSSSKEQNMGSKVLSSELDEDGRKKRRLWGEVQMRRSSRFKLEGAAGSVAARRRHNGYTFPTLRLETPCTVAHLQRTAGLCFSTTRARQVTIRTIK